jgi:HEAT repeat protein
MMTHVDQSSGRNFPLALVCLLIFVASACGQAPTSMAETTYTPRADPLYQQCASLDGSPASKGKVEAQLAALKSGDAAARVKAAEELARSCDRQASAPLLTAAKEDKDLGVRVAAITALGQLGDRETIDPLIELINDPDWHIQLPLSRALCSFQVERASYAVLNFLVKPAIMESKSDGELYARCQGILMVCQLREEGFARKAIHFILALIDLKQPTERQIVETTLRELGKTRDGAYQLVLVLDQNLNPVMRNRAAFWIGELGIEHGNETLVQAAASDRDARVRQTATEALNKIKQKHQ